MTRDTLDISDRIFVMTGIPRGGTTYLSAVLHHPPQTITLSEAGGKWKQAFRNQVTIAQVVEILENFYGEVLVGNPVKTLEGTAGFKGQQRVDTWNQPKVTKTFEVEETFKLGVKNPEVFLEWLSFFQSLQLKTVISVRHPVSVIHSWTRKGQVRIARGKTIKGTFANGDACTFTASHSEVLHRKIELYNYFTRRIIEAIPTDTSMVFRYEDWFRDPNCLQRITDFLDIPCPEQLSPALIPPDPITALTPTEVETILTECTIAEALGYPTVRGKLLPLS